MMNFFKSLYRRLYGVVNPNRLQKEYEELINIFRTAVPLDIADLDAIENAMSCLVKNRVALAERFHLLRLALKQRKQLGSDIKSRYSVFIANEHDRLAKRKIDKDRDVSYGVNGNIIYGDVDSNEEEEYFTGENIKALNSEPFREKYCDFDCESAKCKSCIEVRLRREILQKLQLEEELKREERVKKRRMENDRRVVTALNEKLGCPLIIARSLTDDTFTLDELESEDREEFLRWKENNRQLAKKINVDIFKSNETQDGVFADEELEKERNKAVSNRTGKNPIKRIVVNEQPNEINSFGNPFGGKSSSGIFGLEDATPREGATDRTNFDNPFAIANAPPREKIELVGDETLEVEPVEMACKTEDKIEGNEVISKKAQLTNPFKLTFNESQNDVLSTSLKNPFLVSKGADEIKARVENSEAGDGVSPAENPITNFSVLKPTTPFSILDQTLEKPELISTLELCVPEVKAKESNLLNNIPKFSFDNPFQTSAKPMEAPLSVNESCKPPREAVKLLNNSIVTDNQAVINATETSPLSNIIANNPFSNNNSSSTIPSLNTANINGSSPIFKHSAEMIPVGDTGSVKDVSTSPGLEPFKAFKFSPNAQNVNSTNPFSSLGASPFNMNSGSTQNTSYFGSNNPFVSVNQNTSLNTEFTAPLNQSNDGVGSSSFFKPFTTNTNSDFKPPLYNINLSLENNPFKKRSDVDGDSSIPNVFSSNEETTEARSRRARRKRD
ncbi:hypothetical protein PAEPH01_1348 [Pancytospora epiphaga]|nr:hypothetical protein PAEPH01_1348 [Pancytospora epiphaga]